MAKRNGAFAVRFCLRWRVRSCSVVTALAGCAGCDAHEEAGLLLGLADPLFLSDVVVGLVKDFILI